MVPAVAKQHHHSLTQPKEPITLASLLGQLEELWRHWDEVMDSLRPDDWRRKHGRAWRFADVPYHLAYFDDEVIAQAIARGADVPASEQVLMRSHGEFNAWNARKLAARPASQTVEQSLAQMRASRAAIRRAVARLSDADLERPVWIALTSYGGWRTVRYALEFCRMHSWAHFTQFRLRLKRDRPVESPAITHGALDSFVRSFPALLNRIQARQARFTLVLEFTGGGGGVWTIRVIDGGCTVTEEQAVQADLVITQSPEMFAQLLAAMRHPLVAIISGQLKVRGLWQVGSLMKLFQRPKRNQPLELVP